MRDDQLLPRPPGNQCKALSLLVLNGGCINRDALIEHLWADKPIAVGRHHLRNLLTQLRESSGLDIQRQDDLVVITDQVWCDIEAFMLTATRALAGVDDADECRRLGLAAQQLWAGPPLESYRYDRWANQLRDQAFSLRDQLWALLPADATSAVTHE